MNLKKYLLQQAEESIHETLTEEDIEFVNQLVAAVGKEELEKAEKRSKSFFYRLFHKNKKKRN